MFRLQKIKLYQTNSHIYIIIFVKLYSFNLFNKLYIYQKKFYKIYE